MLEQFPFPSLQMLYNLHSGGIDYLKAVLYLHGLEATSKDMVPKTEDAYLHERTQYQACDYSGCSTEGKRLSVYEALSFIA